jgi:alkylation response protein AidB-like acyl-CoA dehydrogenase
VIDLLLNREQRELTARVAALGDKFRSRADHYDATATFPFEDFEDLFRAGLLAPAIPTEHGGLGLGPYRGGVFALWMMTKELAKADLSLARCWEGHVNSLVLLDGIATESQKERWFGGVVQRGEKWVAWSGEPQAPAPGETARFGTTLRRQDSGYVIEGTKVFATSAGAAQWAILLSSTAGPGAARHATAARDTVLMLACNLSDPTVEVDGSWWNPIGMRATVSHLVRFHGTFIPEENVLGYPGQYLTENWQTCFIPHYAASFLGAAEGAYEYALEHIRKQCKGGDPYVQQHAGQMSINVDTGYLWLKHVADLWEEGRHEEARTAGIRARHLIETLAEDTVKRAIRACGARSLNRPSALERIYRDLSFYVRHDNADHISATVGKSVLGDAHDASFFKP